MRVACWEVEGEAEVVVSGLEVKYCLWKHLCVLPPHHCAAALPGAPVSIS